MTFVVKLQARSYISKKDLDIFRTLNDYSQSNLFVESIRSITRNRNIQARMHMYIKLKCSSHTVQMLGGILCLLTAGDDQQSSF